ncbi:ATPase inhibitor subunit zeta [Rhizobium sp. 3T7]|uniref:ATPase inhibitor subunit zeta n=1 Tax=Rhizobium sp. 3T7 TaxID=2874922 RepID=UPI0029621B12|nr:ATPase inhibitor subunit zeta [Rhizobium sp. 3T7]
MQSRRDRVLAQWVAEPVGATDVQAYVAEIIDVRTTAAGDEGVIAKILADVRERIGSFARWSFEPTWRR